MPYDKAMHLLEYFNELTLKPENAKKLKGLILELAIQGKLTAKWREKNPDVEPASVLLEQIKEEKEKLIKEKKIKKEKELPKIATNERLFDIPNIWEFVRLGELGDWGAGATPKRSMPEYYGGDINWYKSGELNNGIIDYDSKEKITELGFRKSSVRLNKSGDVLLAMYGATIGKTAILEKIGTTNQAVCGCTCFKGFSNTFLLILLKGLKRVFINQGEGGAQPNISRVKIRTQAVPLPPLAEQKEIVKVVEGLLKEVDHLVAQTKQQVQLKEDYVTSALRVLSKSKDTSYWDTLLPQFQTFFDTEYSVKQLRATILQLAVQGKLTAKWRAANPDREHASELLDRIKAEKAKLITEKKIKKEKPLPEVTEDEIPFELPDGWIWCRLGEILKYTDSGKSPNCKKIPVVDDEWGVLTTTSIQRNLFLENANKILPSDFVINQKMVLEIGDVLITRAGPIQRTGIVCHVENLSSKLILSDKTVRLKYFSQLINGRSLSIFLNSPELQIDLKSRMTGMAESQVNISQGNIKKVLFPLSSVAEQAEIIRRIDLLIELTDYLSKQIKVKKALSKDWMTSSSRQAVKNKKSEALTYEKKFIIAAEIVSQLNGEYTLGHVKLQKLLYFCQELKGVKLNATFLQQAAGPYDPKLARDIDMYFEMSNQYLYDGDSKLKYRLLAQHGNHTSEYNKLPHEERETVQDVIDLFRKTNSDDIGMYATLHAVWKKAKHSHTIIPDELLLKGFFDWSEEKSVKYERNQVVTGIRWMENQGMMK